MKWTEWYHFQGEMVKSVRRELKNLPISSDNCSLRTVSTGIDERQDTERQMGEACLPERGMGFEPGCPRCPGALQLQKRDHPLPAGTAVHFPPPTSPRRHAHHALAPTITVSATTPVSKPVLSVHHPY